MNPTLTDDEVRKIVVDAAGKELGIVAAVDGSRAAVDPNPSVLEQTLATIGWEGEDEEDYEVTEEMLDHVGDQVVLRGEI